MSPTFTDDMTETLAAWASMDHDDDDPRKIYLTRRTLCRLSGRFTDRDAAMCAISLLCGWTPSDRDMDRLIADGKVTLDDEP